MSHPFQTASDVRKQPELTEQNYLDLSQIQPLTEAQADEYFNKPTITELYHQTIAELAPSQRERITRYVDHIRQQIDNAYRDGREHAWTRPGFGEMGG
jgi:hypothetical protein